MLNNMKRTTLGIVIILHCLIGVLVSSSQLKAEYESSQGENQQKLPSYVNIALDRFGAVASGSSQLLPFHPSSPASPELAIDGDTQLKTSRWVTNTRIKAPHWLIVDFGITREFDRVKLYWGKSMIVKSYELQYWNDDSWRNISSIHDNTQSYPEYTFKATSVVPGSAMVVKIELGPFEQ